MLVQTIEDLVDAAILVRFCLPATLGLQLPATVEPLTQRTGAGTTGGLERAVEAAIIREANAPNN